ncbi:MAG: hypothetical protein P8X88_07935, partial [Gammaproteobacteria bacterium]
FTAIKYIMKNSLIDVLFFIPIPVILAAAIALYINNPERIRPEKQESSASSITPIYNYSVNSTNPVFTSPDATKYQNYAMTEPFAANVPFVNTPAAWMQMMNNMMNTMQMTQIMHQMATMPMQMMNLAWMNPHGVSPGFNSSPVQTMPMDPAEYKKWYEKQLEALSVDEK